MPIRLGLGANPYTEVPDIWTPLAFGSDLWSWHEVGYTGAAKASDVGAVCTNGDPCGYVADLSGNGRHWRQGTWCSGTNSYRPTFTSGSPAYLLFNGSNALKDDISTLTGPRTVCTIFKTDTQPGVYYTLWAMSGGATRSQVIISSLGGSYPNITYGNDFPGGSVVCGVDWTKDTSAHILTARMHDSENIRTSGVIFIDGVEQTQTVSTGAFSIVTDGAIGGNLNAGVLAQGMIGRIYGQIVISRVISDTEMIALHRYCASKFGISQSHSARPNIVCDGDSLTLGENKATITAPNSYPGQLAALLDQTCRITNLGRSGSTSSYAHSVFSSRGAKLLARGASTNIAVLWYGSNDLGSNGGTISAASLHTNMTTLVSDYKNAGYNKVIVLTVLPRTYAGDPGDYETKRQDYRALVVPGLGGDSCGADAVVDIGSDSTIGDSGDQNNATYYNADKVHLTTAGYAIVAQAVADAINTWI